MQLNITSFICKQPVEYSTRKRPSRLVETFNIVNDDTQYDHENIIVVRRFRVLLLMFVVVVVIQFL